MGGPSYTPDFGALIGGSALIIFRMNPSEHRTVRSVLPMSIASMFSGVRPDWSEAQTFFFTTATTSRIFGKFVYKNTEDNFYGIGYGTNKDYVRSDSTSKYRYSGIQINPWFLFRLGESNVFAGPQVDINYDKISDPAKHLIEEPDYVAAGGTANGYRTSMPVSASSSLTTAATFPPTPTRVYTWISGA